MCCWEIWAFGSFACLVWRNSCSREATSLQWFNGKRTTLECLLVRGCCEPVYVKLCILTSKRSYKCDEQCKRSLLSFLPYLSRPLRKRTGVGVEGGWGELTFPFTFALPSLTIHFGIYHRVTDSNFGREGWGGGGGGGGGGGWRAGPQGANLCTVQPQKYTSCQQNTHCDIGSIQLSLYASTFTQ